MTKLIRMWETEPKIAPNRLSAVRAPTLIMAADRDTIRTEHSVLIAEFLAGVDEAMSE